MSEAAAQALETATSPFRGAWLRYTRPMRQAILTTLLLLTFALETRAQTTLSRLAGDPAHPALAINWLDTKLYFGLGPADARGRGISRAKWRRFLDSEVTPRFPAGLSVLDVYGQWLSRRDQTTPGAQPQRIRTKLLVIEYPATVENAERIEAIRTAWKRLTGDQSVLKVTQPAEVSF